MQFNISSHKFKEATDRATEASFRKKTLGDSSLGTGLASKPRHGAAAQQTRHTAAAATVLV